jgi:hypothetical protein
MTGVIPSHSNVPYGGGLGFYALQADQRAVRRKVGPP